MTRCQINKDSVGCEAPFTHSPLQDGEHANGVSITAGGSVQWVLGNLGAIPTVTIDYKTYDALGWTINATTDGTRVHQQPHSPRHVRQHRESQHVLSA